MGIEAHGHACSLRQRCRLCNCCRSPKRFFASRDLIEDVMIGYGLNKFEPEMPQDFTVGRLSPAEEMGRKVKDSWSAWASRR
jgi:hypothetical protein